MFKSTLIAFAGLAALPGVLHAAEAAATGTPDAAPAIVAAQAAPAAVAPEAADASQPPLAAAVPTAPSPESGAASDAAATPGADTAAPLDTYDRKVGWLVSFAPYAWAIAADGHAAQFGLPLQKVHQSRGSLLRHFDYGFMLAAEARHGKFSLFTDIFIVKVGTNATSPFPATISNKELMWTSGVGYQIARTKKVQLDVMAGARVWRLRSTATVTAGPIKGAVFHDGADWTDPYIGTRLKVNLSRRFYFYSWAQVGGFGVGAKSMWDLQGSIGYRILPSASLLVGYRGLGANYRKGAYVYDIVKQGPFAGAVVHF